MELFLHGLLCPPLPILSQDMQVHFCKGISISMMRSTTRIEYDGASCIGLHDSADEEDEVAVLPHTLCDGPTEP